MKLSIVSLYYFPSGNITLSFSDDYFLSNVKIIDDVTEEKKQQLLTIAQWPDAIQAAVGTWPCFNVIPEPDGSDQPCAACGKGNVSTRVQVYGQPYNSTTLEGCPPDPTIAAKKVFLFSFLV